jgi:hypothetical protein
MAFNSVISKGHPDFKPEVPSAPNGYCWGGKQGPMFFIPFGINIPTAKHEYIFEWVHYTLFKSPPFPYGSWTKFFNRECK